MKITQNVIGILANHYLSPMVVVFHNIHYISNLLLITNINGIVMMAQHKNSHPEICMIGEKWIIIVTLIVVYQSPK